MIATVPINKATAAERTAAIRLALRAKYARPEWLLFEEISLDGLGRVDALAINCWSSSGFEIHGFEIKASRADWMRELQHMEKSARAFDLTDRWWLVSPTDVATKEEIPPTWGWLTSTSTGRLRKTRQAPHHEKRPLGMRQLVNLLSREHPRWVVTPEEERLASRREYQRGFDEGRRSAERSSFDQEKLEALSAFEKRTGISLYGTTVDRLTEAVLYLTRRNGEDELRRSIRRAREQAQRFITETGWVE